MSKRCSAKNRNGKRCRAWAVRGALQCSLHSQPGRATQLGSKHGRALKARLQGDVVYLPYRPLKNAEQVCEMLKETINRVRQGSLDSSTAHTIGFLAGTYLKVHDQAQIEQAAKGSKGCRSPFYLASSTSITWEHYTASRPETGLLISSVFSSRSCSVAFVGDEPERICR
jgi:hypothetical protein